MFKKSFYFTLMFCGIQSMYGADGQDVERAQAQVQQQKVSPYTEAESIAAAGFLVEVQEELNDSFNLLGELFLSRKEPSKALVERLHESLRTQAETLKASQDFIESVKKQN